MSFIYPRVLRITRSAVSVELGKSEYSGESAAKEQCIAEGVPASIQMKQAGGKPDAGLPADAAKKTFWRVLIPLGQLKMGTIQTRDILTDDLGERYAVTSNYWNSLGYNLLAEKLEL